MNTRWKVICLLISGGLSLITVAACDQSKQPLSHDEIIRADLTEIIALEGLDCGKVVSHSLEDHLDYRIECESGDVYRIHVSAEGHTRVNPQEN